MTRKLESRCALRNQPTRQASEPRGDTQREPKIHTKLPKILRRPACSFVHFANSIAQLACRPGLRAQLGAAPPRDGSILSCPARGRGFGAQTPPQTRWRQREPQLSWPSAQPSSEETRQPLAGSKSQFGAELTFIRRRAPPAAVRNRFIQQGRRAFRQRLLVKKSRSREVARIRHRSFCEASCNLAASCDEALDGPVYGRAGDFIKRQH